MTEHLPPVSPEDLEEVLRWTSPDVWTALRSQSIFLTGGTGFVGKWLLECLLHADRALDLGLELTVLTRDPDAFSRASPHLCAAPALELIKGDVTDFKVPRRQYSHVLHAALPVGPPVGGRAGLEPLATAGARHVCEFAKAAGARRLLHVSSGSVYGARAEAGALPEDAPWTAVGAENDYTRAKRASEAVVMEAWPFDVVIARCFAFTGPYLLPSSGSAAAEFVAKAAAGQQILVKGTGEAVRSYQYASDMGRWLLTCMVRGEPGRTYNVGSGVPVTIGELAQRVTDLADVGLPVESARQPTVGLAGNVYVPDVRRASEELGLTNRVDLDDGLRRALRWWAALQNNLPVASP